MFTNIEFFVVMLWKENFYVIALLPIPINSTGRKNDILKEFVGSSSIKRLIVKTLPSRGLKNAHCTSIISL